MSEISLDSKQLKSDISPAELILLKCAYEPNKTFFNDFCKVYGDKVLLLAKSLEKRLYIKLIKKDVLSLDSYDIRQKGLDLFDTISKIDFNDFWNKYHEITHLPKTDKVPTNKYWKGLTNKEKDLAYNNIENYFNSLNDKRYCKKARTYLADKNFLDEWEIKQESINRM
jgi:hypothetical protein